jgi:hypothetical protein
MTRPEQADFLRALAQNDYMIDQHFLPTGATLNTIADSLLLLPDIRPAPLTDREAARLTRFQALPMVKRQAE